MMANKVLIVWSFLHLRYPFPPLFTPGLHSTLTTWVILLVSEPIKHAPICLGAFSTNSNASEFFLHTNNSITKTLLKCPLLSETYPNYPFKNYKLFHISIYSCLKNKFIYLFIFGCTGSSLLRVGFSLVAVSGGYSSLRCIGFSCSGARAPGAWASVVVVHGLSCSAACGIFPDQGSNPCSLHWQADP